MRAEVSHSQDPKYGSKNFEGSSCCCGDVLPACEKGMLQEKMQLVPAQAWSHVRPQKHSNFPGQ